MTFAKKFKAARGERSQETAAAAISPKLSVRTLQEWESGRRAPPEWVQHLVLEKLKR